MHNAPSVTYPVGRSRLAGLLLAAFWLAGAAVTAAWAARDAGPAWRQALAAAVVLTTGICTFAGWRRCVPGVLGWDGLAWRWEPAHSPAVAPVEVAGVLDLQRALLLRVWSDGRVHWLWAAQASAPARWRELRRAVYSRARPDTLPGALPPPAKP